MTFLTARGAPPPLARAAALEDSLSSRGPQALLTARGAPALLNAPGAPPPGAAARLAALARRSSGLSLARAAALEDSLSSRGPQAVRARLILLTLAIAATTSVGASAQRTVTTGAQNVPLTAAVPVDPRITVGTLANGLRYYIRRNQQPQGRAELRLVVNAGSILEDDDQRGLAHFVEHMAFNGTRHFPKQESIAFLQSMGMRFGAHINANTSFDQTVYQLQIPTDNAGVIDRSLLILEDWAQAVSFDPQEIEKERGVILEEWRVGLGPGARMLDAQLPVLLKDSRYADRLPIGKPEIIRTFPHDRLKKFYTDWYRPDLMAVIAVGDFEPAAIEALIRSHFGGDPGGRHRRGRGRSTTCPISRAHAIPWPPTARPPPPRSASPA